VIRDYDIGPDDVVIVISNSGRNPAPVEMAMEAKERGARIIALTSMAHCPASARSTRPASACTRLRIWCSTMAALRVTRW